ncbi:MAG: D-beta-D-heptose 7-phosphate kinase/D-beta-D-heptose 1-phosphate adenosyltransferase [Planctomycetota bacterium]|jgi:D-beta-D-heptose 7-phosphate kinase/D-beta-D-heptose 1-phosphate adenosyltransferase
MTNYHALEALLDELSTPNILIVGDLIMDCYVTGEVSRISPEAPIPVLGAKHSELRLGGAGNVAANLRAMGAEVNLLSVVGDDEYGRSLQQKLEEVGARASLVLDPSRPTIEKTRLMSGVQQMLRVDWEDTRPLAGKPLEQLLDRLKSALAEADAVILSDYGKGVLTESVIECAISAARDKQIPILVDPKGHEYERYHGATLITPNKREAETALGRKIESHDDLLRAADELIGIADLESIVITLGADGIYFRTKDGDAQRDPTRARAVFDVVGAGDTVVAHLAMYLAAGLGLKDAVALANQAAGIVVGRLGTSAVTRAELVLRLAEERPQQGKILEDATLGAVLEDWRRQKKRIAFTNGCFDILHVGHVNYLRFSASKADVLIVGVNDDASVRRLKGDTRPVNPLQDRLAVLAALEMVDAVVSFGEDTPARIIEQVTPDVLIKGEDWADKGVVGREWVESHGGQVVLAPLVQGRSTTAILDRARHGRAGDASEETAS